jgi:hypothetical protein
MAAQQHPDCFAPYLRYQLPLYSLFGDQPYRPPSLSDWRIATDHCNDPLFLRPLQQLFGTPARAFEHGLIQAALLVTACNPPNRLWREVDDPRYRRSGLADAQLI